MHTFGYANITTVKMDIILPKTENQIEYIQLIGIEDVSKQLSISFTTLRRWDKSGKLKAIRLTPNGKRFYKKSDIDGCIKPKLFVLEGSEKVQGLRISLKEFGEILEKEEDGKKAYVQAELCIKNLNEKSKIEIDFTDIQSIGIEWGEAFLSQLHQKYGDRILLINVESPECITILEILGLYVDPYRLIF